MATNISTGELPSITGHTHTHSLISPTAAVGMYASQIYDGSAGISPRLNPARAQQATGQLIGAMPPKKQEEKMANAGRRYVQIFIADPDARVPNEQSLIYSSEPRMTDLDDQELFFEVEIKRLLDHYNESVRTKTRDRGIKDREVYLEPARIRDLAMNVTTIAKFG